MNITKKKGLFAQSKRKNIAIEMRIYYSSFHSQEMTYINFRLIEPGLAQITTKNNKKHMIIQVFSEIKVEVYVKRDTLKGNIVILD